jgi:hypothetical protein
VAGVAAIAQSVAAELSSVNNATGRPTLVSGAGRRSVDAVHARLASLQ